MAHEPLDLICVEPTFPGRLGGVADWLVRRRGYRVRFHCHRAGPRETWPESTGRGIDVIGHEVGGIAASGAGDWTGALERGLCHAFAGWEVLDARRARPIDLILGRSAGLGSTLFAPVAYPRVPIVQQFDGFPDLARPRPGGDVAGHRARVAAGAIDLVDLENGVRPWTPTEYQRDLFPAAYRDDFLVLFDGVETRHLPRRHRGRLAVGPRTVPEGASLITVGSRSIDGGAAEPLLRLLDDDHDRIAIAIGTRSGAIPAHDRFWPVDAIPIEAVRQIRARADVHLDPRTAGPVGRSLVEAMAAGSVVVAVDRPAAREFVDPGRTGWLAADPESIGDLAARALADRDGAASIGPASAEAARARFGRDVTLPRLVAEFDRLVRGAAGR